MENVWLYKYISAWASALLVSARWAMRRPRIAGRAAVQTPALFSYLHQYQTKVFLGSLKTAERTMKKTNFKWTAILLSSMLCIDFISCSKDDDLTRFEEETEQPSDGEDPSEEEQPEENEDNDEEKPSYDPQWDYITDWEEKDKIDAADPRRGSVSTEFEGMGTSSSPYLIRSAADLRLMADECMNGNTFKGKYFKMTADIIINENVLDSDGNPNNADQFERWIPIGRNWSYNDYGFHGNFDGNGHTISGIYINRYCDNTVGLFGTTVSANIKNLTLKDSYIYSNNSALYQGGIIGQSIATTNNITISNCHNYATVAGETSGGVLGCFGHDPRKTYTATISRCSNHGKVSGAGIVFYINSREKTSCIEECANFGTILTSTATLKISGGIVGDLFHGNISNCINVGEVVGEENGYIGGICGYVHIGSIKNCATIYFIVPSIVYNY